MAVPTHPLDKFDELPHVAWYLHKPKSGPKLILVPNVQLLGSDQIINVKWWPTELQVDKHTNRV